jgi:hypothetical protein
MTTPSSAATTVATSSCTIGGTPSAYWVSSPTAKPAGADEGRVPEVHLAR